MSKRKLIAWLLTFVKPLRGKMSLAILLGILSNLSVIVLTMIGAMQVLAMLQGDFSHYKVALFWMLGCGIFRGFARYAEQYLNHEIAFRLLAIIRSKIFQVLRTLGGNRISGKKSGDLVTAITTDVEALEVFFAHTISPCFIALGTTIVTVLFQMHLDFRLGLLLLVGQLIVGVLIPVFSYQQYQKTGDDYQETFSALNQTVMENVESLGEVAQFQLQQKRIDALNQKGAYLNQQYQKRLRQGTYIQILSEIALILTGILTLILGNQWQLPFHIIFPATILSLSSFGSVLALSGLGNTLLATFASGQRLYQLTHEEPAVTFPKDATSQPEGNELQAKNISFHYPNEHVETLKEISLQLKAGKTIGIGGESGSGKTTLLHLLLRDWDPQEGAITIDETSLSTLTEKQLRALESVMSQTTFLFENTIAENISLGEEKYTFEDIEAAAKKAAIHQWILSLPDGYETKLEKNNRLISDGERQRIGLARLFLYDAPIFLLDEPTSNLDYLNEKRILQLLKEECANKATLIISHRETTLAIAEECYQMEKGNLIKQN